MVLETNIISINHSMERKIYALCTLLIFLSIAKLVSGNRELASESMSAGEVVKVFNDVRQKKQGHVAWKKISTTVAKEDLIFSGDDSQTVVRLDSGSVIILGPNTLVKISNFENRSQIQLQQGFIKAKMSPADTFAFDHAGKTLNLTGKDLEFNFEPSDQSGRLQIVSGEAKLRMGNESLDLTANSVTSLTASGSLKDVSVRQMIKLKTPEDGKEFYAHNSVNIEFSVDTCQECHFEFSKEPRFKNIISSVPVGEMNKLKFSEQGVYYWRVIDALKNISETRSFIIHSIDIPQIIVPDTDGQVFKLLHNEPVSLRWNKPSSKITATITDALTQSVVETKKTLNDSIYTYLPPGTYILTLAPELKESGKQLPTVSRRFSVEIYNFHSPPLELSKKTINLANETLLTLTWPKLVKESSYQIHVKHLDTTKIFKVKPWQRSLDLFIDKTGDYEIYWVVDHDQKIYTSTPEKFQAINVLLLKVPKIENLRIQHIKVKVSPLATNRGVASKNNLDLRWEEINGAKIYEIEISRSPNFSSLVDSFKQESNSLVLNIEDFYLGNYYWRVRALNQLLEPSAFSETGLIQIRKWAPKINLSVTNKSIVLSDLHSHSISWNIADVMDSAKIMVLQKDGRLIQQIIKPIGRLELTKILSKNGTYKLWIEAYYKNGQFSSNPIILNVHESHKSKIPKTNSNYQDFVGLGLGLYFLNTELEKGNEGGFFNAKSNSSATAVTIIGRKRISNYEIFGRALYSKRDFEAANVDLKAKGVNNKLLMLQARSINQKIGFNYLLNDINTFKNQPGLFEKKTLHSLGASYNFTQDCSLFNCSLSGLLLIPLQGFSPSPGISGTLNGPLGRNFQWFFDGQYGYQQAKINSDGKITNHFGIFSLGLAKTLD
jgi:hypothetical protein